LKKQKLSVTANNEFSALGIASAEKDYRLCYQINKSLQLELERSANITVFDTASKKSYEVLCYYYNDKEQGARLYFVKNRQEQFIIIPQYKQADYFFLLQSLHKSYYDTFKKSLTELKSIQSVFPIPDQNITNIDAE
jgi:hypothetical protein